ncbi:hypothetical protein AGMMS50256_21490 [Betaproteobacteria bacterium]|nr:hypothetical protein AGMMS50256_21490 [Betaproteobacteria bacterium]
MNANFPESDWRVFRELREVALERFCERVLAKIGRMTADGTKTFHARYLEVYKYIDDQDHHLGSAFNNPRRSAALMQLITMISFDLITDEELLRFTERTRSAVEILR